MEQTNLENQSSPNCEPLPNNEPWANQPLCRVIWRHREALRPNHYNPNSVAPPELDLLKTSILADGWTQPIVINEDMTIVDGFHRYTVSGHAEIYGLTAGYVPTVMLENKSEADRMTATVRHNRARGTHAILKMADIVEKMHEDGWQLEAIMETMGMEEEEITRLLNRKGVKVNIETKDFGLSWSPN